MNCALFAKMDQIFSLKNKTFKKYWKNGKKYWKSQGKVRILSVRKSGNPDYPKSSGKYPVKFPFHLLLLGRVLDTVSDDRHKSANFFAPKKNTSVDHFTPFGEGHQHSCLRAISHMLGAHAVISNGLKTPIWRRLEHRSSKQIWIT